MYNKISKEDIKKIIIEAIEFRFDEDTKNTILKSKSFDGEDQYIYKDLHLDSLDVIEMLLDIEYDINHALGGFGYGFGENITIDDDIVNEELTIRGLIDHIYNKING